MWRHLKVSLTDLIFSVSEAMDLSDPRLVDHQVRTGFICSELARAGNLSFGTADQLFLAALLHDIGALSPEEKIGIHNYEDLRPEPHCLRGAKLFAEAFWLAPSASIIEWHHTHFREHRKAGRSISDDAVMSSQMLFLADHLERAIDRQSYILHQSTKLKKHIYQLKGEAIHADVVALFDEVSASEDFWLELVSKNLATRLRDRNPLRAIDLDFAAARAIASVFKDMTDFRSRFTAAHSAGVACCARGIAQRLGFSGKDLQQIELAGFLHDIGKLVVPNAILCKPEKLTANEYAIVRQHPYYTHRILSRVRGFEQIAEWAAFHHERLDGSGYTNRLVRDDLDLGAKIIAVADVATAIAERRPYRGPGNETSVLNTLRKMVKEGLLEAAIVDTLATHYANIMGAVQVAQEADETRYIERYAAIA